MKKCFLEKWYTKSANCTVLTFVVSSLLGMHCSLKVNECAQSHKI